MEIERKKLKLQELIDDVKVACRKGAYQNCLSLRSLACCFLPQDEVPEVQDIGVRNRLLDLINKHSTLYTLHTTKSVIEEQATDASTLETSSAQQSTSLNSDMSEALLVLKEHEPVLFHAISGFLRQNHGVSELVCLDLLVLLKVALLSPDPDALDQFQPKFKSILDTTNRGRQYIDLAHLHTAAEREVLVEMQPRSPLQWVSLNEKNSRSVTIQGAQITAKDSHECTTIALTGWRLQATGTWSFNIQLSEPHDVKKPQFRVGWISYDRKNPTVLIGDDSNSIAFDGHSIYHNCQCVATLNEVYSSWSSVQCSIDVDRQVLIFKIDQAKTELSFPIPNSLQSTLIPSIGFGQRTFRSLIDVGRCGMYPGAFRSLGYLFPLPTTNNPADSNSSVDLIEDCFQFSSDCGTICRLHPAVIPAPKAWTISFWVYPLAVQDNSEPRPWRTIFLKGQDHTMERTCSVFLSCDRLMLAVCVSTQSDWNSTLVSSGPIPAETWTHIAIVCENLTLRLFIQGKEDRTLSLNDAVIHNRHPFYFGKSPPGVKKTTTDYKGFRGYVRHAVFYPTRACSGKDITKSMKEKKQMVESTNLALARSSMASETIVQFTTSWTYKEDIVTYFVPALGGFLKVTDLVQSIPKWPDEIHMEATIRAYEFSPYLQVLAACTFDVANTGFVFIWGVTQDGRLSVRTKDRKFTTTGRYVSSKLSWVKVGLSYTPKQVVFFIDGHKVETLPSSGAPFDTSSSTTFDLYVGALPYELPFASVWTGDIGSFRILKSEAQCCNDDVAHYSFSEGRGWIVYDLSSSVPRFHGRVLRSEGWKQELDVSLVTEPVEVDFLNDKLELHDLVISFMENLASTYLKSSSLLKELDTSLKLKSGAVWPHVLTFLLLHSLLKQLLEKETQVDQGRYILSVLKILRANFEPLASVMSKKHHIPVGISPASVGLGLSESSSFAQRLNDLLVHLISTDVDFVDEDTMKLIQQEAIETHVAGLEIFYPTTQKRADFLVQSLQKPLLAEEICRVLISKEHLVMQLLPFTENERIKSMFPWTVEKVKEALLDSKTLNQEQVVQALQPFHQDDDLDSMSPEQLVVLYDESYQYYHDNHSQLTSDVFKQLWKSLVQHLTNVCTDTFIFKLVSMLQMELIKKSLAEDAWDLSTTSRLKQWNAPTRYFKVINCPIGVRATPNVKALKIGRTLNIGQVIESNCVVQKADESVVYVAHGDGWVFDVDPNDGMQLLEEQVLDNITRPVKSPYMLNNVLQDVILAKEMTNSKGWLQYEIVDDMCKLSDSSRTVTYSSEEQGRWSSALANKHIKQGSGVYTWRIKVNHCTDIGHVIVGLSKKDIPSTHWIGSTSESYGWVLTGDFYHNNQRTKSTSLPLFSSRNIPLLDLTVNTNSGTLIVSNADSGSQYGPTYSLDLTPGDEYFPAVSLFHANDSVSWMSPILFPSESAQLKEIPKIEPLPLTVFCAKALLTSYRNALLQEGAVGTETFIPLISHFSSNMCLWTSMLDEQDTMLDLIESIFQCGSFVDDNFLTLGCLTGQLYGHIIYGGESSPIEEGAEQKWVQSKLFQGGLGKRTESFFLRQFLDGNCPSLEKSMLRFVGGSALVLRMGGPALDRAIRGVIASMLAHCGMISLAEGFDTENSKVPPKPLRLIWQKAMELKSWALRYKTTSKTSYDVVASALTAKVDLLLSLFPSKTEEYMGHGEPPSLTRRISMGSKRSNSFDSTSEESSVPEWLTDLLQSIFTFYKDVDCNVKRIHDLLSSAQHKAISRASGLRRTTAILCSTNVSIPVKAAILHHVLSVLRENNTHLWHYQFGIAGCPVTTKREVHIAFEGYYFCITQLLSCGSFDLNWQMVLLDACAMRIMPEDHVMLSSCRIFQILQDILDRTGDTPSFLGLRQATMKVVYLLAVQVASEGEDSDNLDSLSPPHFKRQVSGPQTLSANVFDMLYSEMYVEVTSMLELRNAQYRLDAIGNSPSVLGILSLLQFVSVSSVCQTFLCTPNWLTLLLTTVCFGQVEPQVRAMQLLHTLLPLCDPTFLGIDLMFDLATLTPIGSVCSATALLEFFLDSVGLAMTPVEKSTQQLPRSVESCLSLGSESTCILRTLLLHESWQDQVRRCLCNGYNSNLMFKQLGVLGVMGSFAEPLRFGSQVEADDGTQGLIVDINMESRLADIQKLEDQSISTKSLDDVRAVPKLIVPIHSFPPQLIESVLIQTSQLVDSVFFLHHVQVARLVFNEEPSRLLAFVDENSSIARTVFEIGSNLTSTNGLHSLQVLEEKFEMLRYAQYANTYGAIRDALYPVSQSPNIPQIQKFPPEDGIPKIEFGEGILCTLKQVSTFDVPVDITPEALRWLEELLNHILFKTAAEIVQNLSRSTDLAQIEITNIQMAVEKVYGLIQLPEMLQAACAEANEWLSNREHWGKEWAVHESSIVLYLLAQLSRSQTMISMDQWREKCATLNIGSYLCATCECLVADILSLSVEVLRNSDDNSSPIITMHSILEAMRGDEELGRLLRYHEAFQTQLPAAAKAPAVKTSDEKVLDVRIQSMITMGFPESWCRRALDETSQDVNAALNWILTNGHLLNESGIEPAHAMDAPPTKEEEIGSEITPSPSQPIIEWNTVSECEIENQSEWYWGLENPTFLLQFSTRTRTGAFLRFYESPGTIEYEVRISDKSLDLYYRGNCVESDIGSFCNDSCWIPFWIACTSTHLWIGQSSDVQLDRCVLQWERQDDITISSFSFSCLTSRLLLSGMSWNQSPPEMRSRQEFPPRDCLTPLISSNSVSDLTYCFYDRQLSHSSYVPFNVWSPQNSRSGYRDALTNFSSSELSQHLEEMSRILRILYARRLGLSILAFCKTKLSDIFRDHESLLVKFVSLVSNRQSVVSDMAQSAGIQWYLPRKQTIVDLICPTVQLLCESKNPLSQAICDYLETQMRLFVSDSASVHWIEPSEHKTDIEVREGSDLRFLVLITEWLLPVKNVVENTLFSIWSESLRSSHVHVKQKALHVMSSILHRSLKDEDVISLNEYAKKISLPYVQELTARLLKVEEENFPMFSRYLQANIEFLSVLKRVLEYTKFSDPHYQYGLFFKGHASYVDINGDDIQPPWTAQYTLCPSPGGSVAVISNSNASSFQLRCGKLFNNKSSFAIKIKASSQLYPFEVEIPNEKWSVLTLTASTTTVSLYVNGVLYTSRAISNLKLPMAHIGDPTLGYRGWISNVRYFESSLTPSQIQVLYQADMNRVIKPPEWTDESLCFDSLFPAMSAIAHWSLNEGAGNFVRDQLNHYCDVAIHGTKWTILNTDMQRLSEFDEQFTNETLEHKCIFSGTGTWIRPPSDSLAGIWNQQSTKALSLTLYTIDGSNLEGKLELNTDISYLVRGTCRPDGYLEFSIVSTRHQDNCASKQVNEWMENMKFEGWHGRGTLKGTWSMCLTRSIPSRHESAMYFLPPVSDSVVLTDGGRTAMSTLRKNKKKASIVCMGFGHNSIKTNWTANGIPISDLSLTSQLDNYNHTDGFATIRCDALVCRGKVYYELTLKTDGLMQLGFASRIFKPAFSSHGVGDHYGSFGVDGKRQRKWCNTGTPYGGDWTWNCGDIIGVLVDFDDGIMRFTHQGLDLGVAFTQEEYPQIKWSDGLYPAGSFSNGQGATFNLGHSPFQYQPQGYISVLAAAPVFNRVEMYSHRSKGFTPVTSSHRITVEVSSPFPPESISFGVYVWEVVVASLTSSDGIRLGVCIEGVNRNLLLGEDKFGWALCSTGKTYNNNNSQRYSSGFAQGDRIGVELNMYQGTLGFYCNGKYMGVAFSSLSSHLPMDAFINVNKGGFVPAVSIFRPQTALVCLGLKNESGTIQYPLSRTHQEFTGTWRRGQKVGPGKLQMKDREGYYLGTWVDNELHGEPLWCEPLPLCVPTLYENVWKSLRFIRSENHPIRVTRPYRFERGEVVGEVLGDNGELTLPANPNVSLNKVESFGWYSSVPRALRYSFVSSTEDTQESSSTSSIIIDGSWQVDKNQRFVLVPPSIANDALSLSNDLSSATLEPHASAGNHVLIRGNMSMSCGVHYWEVGIQSCSHGSLFIGIASSMITSSEGWGDFGFVSYRVRWCQAEGEQLYGRYFSAGDTIGVRFDMEEGTLSFIKDGDDFTRGRPAVINMGVAFRHLRTQNSCHRLTFVPVIGCSHPGDSFFVKGQKWTSYNRYQWPMERLQQALEASVVIQEAFPNAFLVSKAKSLFLAYQNTGEFLPKQYYSRGGTLVQFTSIMLKKGIDRLQGKDRLSLRYGEAVVLGEKDGVVWYVIEGDEAAGIWYWTASEIKHLLATTQSNIVAEPWNCTACTMLNEPNLSKCQVCDTPQAPVGATEEEADDELEVHEFLINMPESSQDQTSNIDDETFEDLLAGWTHQSDVLLVQQMDTLCDEIGQDPENVEWSHYWGRIQPILGMSEDKVAARVSLLLAWNAQVRILCPYVDFHGTKLLEMPASITGKSLALMRPLIFKRVKTKFWKDMLELTTTHTIPPSDEYERPESLREVSLNRILALDEHKSDKKTVFSQLEEALQSWDNQTLRRAYGDEVQDAGQRRAFYVKFLGEGVDDHGGPYRAVFQTAAWDEPSGTLRLFIPCPNAGTTTGANQDKYVVNPSSPSSSLRFLGKLIGMAIRHRIMVPLNCSDLFWKPLVGMTNDRKDLSAIDTMLMSEMHDLECLGSSEVLALDPEEVIEYLLRVTQAPRNPLMQKLEPLTCETLDRVINESISYKLDSIRIQLYSFMEGLAAIVPYALLNLFTPGQLEELVCGSPEIDLDILQKITVYEGVDASAPHIQYFWQCLEDMTHEQRSQFINFVLARSRLPKSIEEFTLHFKIQPAIITSDDANPDHYLPHSQTCFFSLSLPQYSSKEICMEKLLYAINNSPTMDADFVDRETAGWEHMTG
ncbi:hypothetical protein Ae201684_005970 [Aphanomyces euteiches]|uniref:HECT domain-containing protein n=1 Tax=Aphanomyces euteiches TaxID=100861 RepID=A0A6G0XCW2_9STRA|nr:hypothetical protein Ae201684_005970 [Aphanomyces euteiches]